MERSEIQTSLCALPELSDLLQNAGEKTIFSFLLAQGFKMEFKYEICKDVKEPTVEGCDRDL